MIHVLEAAWDEEAGACRPEMMAPLSQLGGISYAPLFLLHSTQAWALTRPSVSVFAATAGPRSTLLPLPLRIYYVADLSSLFFRALEIPRPNWSVEKERPEVQGLLQR